MRQQLAEAQDTLRAIQQGEVDSLVISTTEGEQVYSIKGAEKPYRILIEEMKEGAVMLSDDNTILYANKGFANMLKLPLDKITGKNIENRIVPSHLAAFKKLLSSGRAGEKAVEMEITLQGKDHSLTPTLISITSLLRDDFKTTFLVITDLSVHMQEEVKLYTDKLEVEIYQRKLAEEALKERTTELEKIQNKLEENAILLEEYANQMEELAIERAKKLQDAERMAAIGATAGMVGHDIRNPLQAMLTDIYLLKEEIGEVCQSKEGVSESLESLEQNIDYINKIVADLQDYARVIAPAAQVVDVCSLCEGVLFKQRILKNIEACCTVEEGAKMLISDQALLKRVLNNLISNAEQAMPQGGKLTLHVYKEKDDVVITIEDTGVGIPKEIKDKLFTPMFTTKAKGQGFGLAVVKRMTEALGGTVTYESEVGKGTKFIVRLPTSEEQKDKIIYKKLW